MSALRRMIRGRATRLRKGPAMAQGRGVLRGASGIVAAIAIVGTVVASVGPAAAQSAPSAEPFARLYDVPPEAAADLSESALSAKRGWTPVEAGDEAHRFQGAAVLMNDKIVAVLHPATADVDVYSRQTGGLKRCARLRPVGADGAAMRRTGLKVRANRPHGVSLEVGLASPAEGPCHVTYDLAVGAAFLRTTAAGVARLRVLAPCRFAVVPDFFGDDIVVDAAALPLARADLPADHFLMHLMHGGECIVMTVSEAAERDVQVAVATGGAPAIESSDIPYDKPHVWVAVLAGRGIWHERTVAAADGARQTRSGSSSP